ncbi:DUF3012 domain-containing protein [Pseudomaricurvus sp. HS19]|uniref:DUF3012 domain-containing protein n=1 Tax=Pseudomaricurvus sp. HS19 TaxID=2692626 RepID=UPI0013691504|nr:DUF3012 domain-containing protein [Pseudomaricurvus sp. HS19]MYM62525.1 DUF3012 domain-containing protein [Pseudomaricurvus sp. HS19]
MKQYLIVASLLLLGLVLVMLGLAFIEGSKQEPPLVGEAWCEFMMNKPNIEWTTSEAESFAKTCLDVE